jgi:hypothetical protein
MKLECTKCIQRQKLRFSTHVLASRFAVVLASCYEIPSKQSLKPLSYDLASSTCTVNHCLYKG